MSAGAQTLEVGPRFARSSPAPSRDRAAANGEWIRLATFAALALYGVVRWAALLRRVPTWRLLGLFAVALVIAGGIPWLWHCSGGYARHRRAAAIIAVIALVLVSFPIAGLPWHLFIHHRIAVSARHIDDGLQALAGVLVPYAGTGEPVVLVINLGAAVLLLDGAIVLAFAPAPPSDIRRAGAALPLIALAIVPSTLVRPQLPYLQGLLLFALLAAFFWGDRVRRDAAGAAVVVAALAGVGAAIAAPRLDTHKALINYRAWAGTLVREHLDSFDWNQTYGPLRWPRSGHEVLTVRAKQGDYWKAEDLDDFNGYAWQQGAVTESALPLPDRAAVKRWTQQLQVTIEGMRTSDVIAAGEAGRPSIPGAVPGVDAGTWTAGRALGPGTVYRVSTYSPSPSAAQLRAAGAYPEAELAGYRTLSIPYSQLPLAEFPAVVFGAFHSRAKPSVSFPSYVPNATRLVQTSPYGGAYALARQLAARAATPYAFVASVERYLSRGYTYNQNPPVRRYPLESFLFSDKLGYCQQFSGAMALLLRMGGIPARVAAGFTSGSFDSASHEWMVSDIDAHAWVEVWFPHYGWVKFDPTPAVAPARRGQSLLPFEKRLAGSSPAAARAPRRQIGSSPTVTRSDHHAARGGSSPWLPITAAALVVLIALGLARILLHRPADQEQLLDELERALARSGRPLQSGVTLAGLERRFHDSPAAAQYIRSLRLARYAGADAGPTASQRRALRGQLSFGLGLVGRLRAFWALPPRPASGWIRRRNGLKS